MLEGYNHETHYLVIVLTVYIEKQVDRQHCCFDAFCLKVAIEKSD